MHDELLGRQGEWNQLPDPSDFLESVAKEIGADMDAYGECIESGRAEEGVTQDLVAADAFGFNGTPTFQFTANFTDTVFTLVGAQPYTEFQS